MRRIVSFTAHPDYLAVEKKYMAFLTIEKRLHVQKMITCFNFTEQQAIDFFSSCADAACSILEEMTPEQINEIIELNNPKKEGNNELTANN